MKTSGAIVLCSIVALCLSASTSHAAQYGVINGATVTWAPQTNYSNVANYDQVIFIGWGTVDANGTNVAVPGVYAAVMPLGSPIPGVVQIMNGSVQVVFESTPAGAPTSLQPSTSYYVYAAVPQGPQVQVNSFWNYVISVVPPWADGYPSSTVYYQMNAGGPPTGGGPPPQLYPESSANSSLIYLGSFITGANGRMVGFNRMGEQVVFATSIGGQYGYPTGIADQQFVQNVTFPIQGSVCKAPTCPYPASVKATFPAGIVPATATAMIVDLVVSGSAAGTTLYLLDPQINGVSGVLFDSFSATIVQNLTTMTNGERIVAPIAQKTPTLNFGAWSQPSVSLAVVYQGYVEPTHHLTFVHP